MAEHGTVEYATADGNDYPAHEASYERFVHFTFVGIIYVINHPVRPRRRRRHGPLVHGVGDASSSPSPARSPAC